MNSKVSIMKKSLFVLFVFVSLFLISCATKELPKTAFEVGMDLADNFLSTDEISNYNDRNGRKPVVVIGYVDTPSNIDYSPIIYGFQQKTLEIGIVDLIIGSDERNKIREERIEQLQWSNSEQAKSLANEMAADYYGRFYLKEVDGKYIVSADFIEVESGKMVWFNHSSSELSLDVLTASGSVQQIQAQEQIQEIPATEEKSSPDKSEDKETESGISDGNKVTNQATSSTPVKPDDSLISDGTEVKIKIPASALSIVSSIPTYDVVESDKVPTSVPLKAPTKEIDLNDRFGDDPYPEKTRTENYYDSSGVLVQAEVLSENGNLLKQVFYNSDGDVTSETFFDGSRLRKPIGGLDYDEEGNVKMRTEWEYDEAGNLLYWTDWYASGSMWRRFYYDASSPKDSLRLFRVDYDESGRLSWTIWYSELGWDRVNISYHPSGSVYAIFVYDGTINFNRIHEEWYSEDGRLEGSFNYN